MTFFFHQVLLLRDLRGITLYLMIYIYIYYWVCYTSIRLHVEKEIRVTCYTLHTTRWIFSRSIVLYRMLRSITRKFLFGVKIIITYAENIFNFKMRLKLTRPSLKWKERLFKDSFSQLIRTLRNSEVSFYIFANREGKLIRWIQRYNE